MFPKKETAKDILDKIFAHTEPIGTAYYFVAPEGDVDAWAHISDRGKLGGWINEVSFGTQAPLSDTTRAALDLAITDLLGEAARCCLYVALSNGNRTSELIEKYNSAVHYKRGRIAAFSHAPSTAELRRRAAAYRKALADCSAQKKLASARSASIEDFSDLKASLEKFIGSTEKLNAELATAIEKSEKLTGDRLRLTVAAVGLVAGAIYFAVGSADKVIANFSAGLCYVSSANCKSAQQKEPAVSDTKTWPTNAVTSGKLPVESGKSSSPVPLILPDVSQPSRTDKQE